MITNKIKLLIMAIGALLIIGGALVGSGAYKRYVLMKEDLAASNRNERAYVSIINKDKNDKRVLELTASDLRQSNDKLINSIDSVRKSLKTPKNKPGDVAGGINTSAAFGGTVYIPVPATFKLDTVIKPNDLTSISLKIEKDSLKYGVAINNTQFLYVYSSREFVNKYGNGWTRFWHFDWKKEDVARYDIKNTNKLIVNGDVIIYKVR